MFHCFRISLLILKYLSTHQVAELAFADANLASLEYRGKNKSTHSENQWKQTRGRRAGGSAAAGGRGAVFCWLFLFLF